MAAIMPILYEVRPSPYGNSYADSAPWVVFIEFDHTTQRYYIWKEIKALNNEGVWEEGIKSHAIPERCLHTFESAVELAFKAVEEWRVDGKTFRECLEQKNQHQGESW